MPYQARQRQDRIEIRLDDEVVAELRWSHNRLHYYPRILRLSFRGFEVIPTTGLARVVEEALLALHSATEAVAPLLLRVTLDEHSTLLPLLKRSGFLETRRVYEPVLPLDRATLAFDANPEEIAGRPLRLLGLPEARARVEDESLVSLFWEVYAGVSRLDPATPERLNEQERTALALGDEDLEVRATTCAFLGDDLVGLCPVYRGEVDTELEVGPFGVVEAESAHHRDVAVAMLRASIVRARELGALRVRAEIDSDDSRTLLACAEFPFQGDREAVSLVFVPRWEHPAN